VKTRSDRWAEIDDSVQKARTLFPVLDSTIWARSLRWARSAEGRRNDVAERIRARILDVGKNKLEPVAKQEKSA
jgi:hypothetical protein